MDKRVQISCRILVTAANPNVVMTPEEYARYERACEEDDNEYFEALADRWCLGHEWESDWEIDPSTVEVEVLDEKEPAG